MARAVAQFTVVAALIMSGCDEDATVRPVPDPVAPESRQDGGRSLEAGQEGVAQLAIDALATYLGIPAERITVDTVRAVDWPDSSIGCPQPGEAYLQVVTPGHKITLRADGDVHVVHEANNRAFVCQRAKAPVSAVTPQYELLFGEQLAFARKDLATRLGVTEGDIKAASAEEATWPDAALGCPEPGMSYTRSVVTGWVLKLKQGSREYSYHTDLDRTIPCPPITAE